jgi:hypothetical protein
MRIMMVAMAVALCGCEPEPQVISHADFIALIEEVAAGADMDCYRDAVGEAAQMACLNPHE